MGTLESFKSEKPVDILAPQSEERPEDPAVWPPPIPAEHRCVCVCVFRFLTLWLEIWVAVVQRVEQVGYWSESRWFKSQLSRAGLSCMLKCSWVRYWTPACSWCAVGTLHGSLCHQWRALLWAGDLSREYPAFTQRQLGLAPAKNPTVKGIKRLQTMDGWLEIDSLSLQEIILYNNALCKLNTVSLCMQYKNLEQVCVWGVFSFCLPVWFLSFTCLGAHLWSRGLLDVLSELITHSTHEVCGTKHLYKEALWSTKGHILHNQFYLWQHSVTHYLVIKGDINLHTECGNVGTQC